MSVDQKWLKTARGVVAWHSPFHTAATECPEGVDTVITLMKGLGTKDGCPEDFLELTCELDADGVYGPKEKAAWAMLEELCGEVTITEQPVSCGAESDSDDTLIE